jgi:hypothetical protein
MTDRGTGWLVIRDGKENGNPLRFYLCRTRTSVGRGPRWRWTRGWSCQREIAELFPTRQHAKEILPKLSCVQRNPKKHGCRIVKASEVQS